MEILALGVRADEKPLIEHAFRDHHEIRCLGVFLAEDTASIAAGGTRMVAQRSTGFDDIGLHAAGRLGMTVARIAHGFGMRPLGWDIAGKWA